MSLDVVRISTGDLDDRVESRGSRLVADGGPGDDAIRGIDLFDVLDGGEGRDRLAGPGRLADADPARLDELDGGVADYSGQLAPLTVDLVSLRSSAGDLLRALTGVIGGRAGDALLGSERRDEISGRSGDDRLAGRRGADLLIGGRDDDTVRGDDGDDSVRGSDGADRLSGGDGADIISGGDGRDRLSGGPGDDALSWRIPLRVSG